ncbi:hypothetical protein B0O80DRAFT_100408 [Mortierella sp. GBAus27b]|nr:hypothetical protein B0O80DRAFT_100408 [Mortierella sp. GBAus27b]
MNPLTPNNTLRNKPRHPLHPCLTIGDILPYNPTFDPLKPIHPHPIPRDQGSPHPFVATFTLSRFREFWSAERVAHQWLPCSEKNSRDIVFGNKENLHQPLVVQRKKSGYSRAGRPRQYDWTFKYACRRSRKEKTLAINRDSVGTGCPANIRFRKLAGEDKVEVTYNWRHNHDTSMESRSLLPSGINELNWVKEKVSRGLDWKGVKSLLRPSEENLQSLEREEKLLLPSVLITYDNVRGAMYRKRTTNSQKASNIVTSVERWIKQIQDNGGKGLFQTNISGDPKSFLVAWCTGFQLRVMEQNRLIACMDSTHKVVRALQPDEKKKKTFPSAYLYTIVVKDRNVQSGIPVAFMICNSEST